MHISSCVSLLFLMIVKSIQPPHLCIANVSLNFWRTNILFSIIWLQYGIIQMDMLINTDFRLIIRNYAGGTLLPWGRSLLNIWVKFSYPCIFLIISKIGYSLIMLRSKFRLFIRIFSINFCTEFGSVLCSRVTSTVMLKVSVIYLY